MINDDTSFSYNSNSKKLNSSIKFNSVCIDNFFSEPDIIRKWGMSLPKQPDSEGNWPGLRSQPLHVLDRNFANTFLLKVISCYFDLKYEDISWKSSNVRFQLINKFDEDKSNAKNIGWIHQDYGHDLAGLIYLTPEADLNTGTSLFNLKPEYEKTFLNYVTEPEKEALYSGEKVNDKHYAESLNIRNNKFYEKTNFSNVYNRLIVYDANEFHRANNFFTKNNERLTLIFFINNISCHKAPMDRICDVENFDNKLKIRINNFYENIKSEEKLPEQTDISDK